MNILLLQALGGQGMQQLLMFGGIILVFYFFMIRPQQTKQKELKKFREGLTKGDEVITSGGIYGKIFAISDQKITLQVDTTTKIVVSKESISHSTKSPEKNNL